MGERIPCMESLNFSSLCNLTYRIWKTDVWVAPSEVAGMMETVPKARKRDIVNLYYALSLPNERLDSYQSVSENRVSDLFSNRANIPKAVRMQLRQFGINRMQENFLSRVLSRWDDLKKKNFWAGLQCLLENTNLGEDVLGLTPFLGLSYDDNKIHDDVSVYCHFVVSAIFFAMNVSNVQEPEAIPAQGEPPVFNKLPENVLEHYDAFTLSGRHARSAALSFILIHSDRQKADQAFYNSERTLEYVLTNNLLVTKIHCTRTAIQVYYRETLGYELRRVQKDDIPAIVHFIRMHHTEFKPKASWNGRNIEDMAENGLKEKWTGYAYFYKDSGSPAAYLDYKMRVDSDIELGIALTEKRSRKQALASGLINLFRLMFPNQRLFTGTYEENNAMRASLEKNNFRPNLFFDTKSGITTNIVRERIDPADPQNKLKYTNSVYYYCNSLLFDVNCSDCPSK